MRKHFVLLTLVLVALTVKAQDTGTVEFFIQPYQTLIKIDGVLLDYSKAEHKKTELPAGTYTVALWASKMAVHYDTIVVVANQNTRYVKALNKKSKEFSEYESKRRKYFWKKTVGHATDVAVVCLDVALATFFFKEDKEIAESYNFAKQAGESYEAITRISLLAEKKANYEELRDKYNRLKEEHNKKVKTGIPIVSVAGGLTIWYFYKRLTTKLKKPIFKESNPFVDIQPSFGFPSSISSDQPVFGVSLKFKL